MDAWILRLELPLSLTLFAVLLVLLATSDS
jgi:hypothetical protein